MWSLMVWLPVFIKYEIIPIQLRYAFWLMLQPFQAPWYRLRKQLVLRGMHNVMGGMRVCKGCCSGCTPYVSCSVTGAALDAALSNGMG